jgi:hypothetical protein
MQTNECFPSKELGKISLSSKANPWTAKTVNFPLNMHTDGLPLRMTDELCLAGLTGIIMLMAA